VGVFFVIYGILSFPYPKEDRHQVGLVVGCIIFFVLGLLSLVLGSWWPLPAGVVLGYGATLILTSRTDARLVLNRRQWQAVARDPDTPTDIRKAIDGGLLAADDIDVQKFLPNFDYLARGGAPSLMEFYTGVDENWAVTPSARGMASPLERPPAYPLWFIAAYPDVVTWMCGLLSEASKQGEDGKLGAAYNAVAEIVGSGLSDGDTDGSFGEVDIGRLKAIVRVYRSEPGNRLECAMESV